MLTQLSIRHYAIVDSLEIEFRPGMSVITGETGAGKSIMLGALGLALGDRADKGVISSGASRTDISAHFDTHDQPLAREWLAENELLSDDEPELCLLRRVVTDDGRSKGWVNGYPVTMQVLKTVGEMLIDIHSQHEHQSLLDRATHQRLLDAFIGEHALLDEVRQISRDWRRNHEQMEALRDQSDSFAAQLELLNYQLRELDALALQEGELEALEAEYKLLSSADTSLAAAQQLLDLCAEGEDMNLQAGLQQALGLLHDLQVKTPALEAVADMLGNAAIQVEEAVRELRHGIDSFEANPERLEEINQRLGEAHQMARKHKCRPEELPALQTSLREQLTAMEHSDEALARHEAQDMKLRSAYQAVAERLSAVRTEGARSLATQINQQIATLGMSQARLEVALSATGKDQPSPTGQESVEFLVSTNPGQPPRPLIKIASGGELSRISLAIQVITAQTSAIPTLVFDEVDVGIGGGVARAVGTLLRQLGSKGQVLCVTHQAQVASQGHTHLFVSKSLPGTTGTRIRELDAEERVREIARMLGGETGAEDFTPESLAHAQEMLNAG
ncbi:MAG: DNA repair protein RecN [Pseudomonadales bacterium]|nr:DNA repair protein RecN [Pseudomonadales bacterium]